jgi:hypothetical protein
MSSVAAPYGWRPVNLLGGVDFSGSTRLMKMTNSYGTAIGYGDAVKLSSGVIVKDTGTTTMTPVGIFLGCTYTDPNTKQLTFKQNWVASTTATDNYAYVLDFPDAIFRIQADATVAQTAVGKNAAVVQNAVGTFGNSAVALQASSVATTNTLPLRIVGFVNGPDSAVGDSYTDCLVIWNAGMHQYENATGV